MAKKDLLKNIITDNQLMTPPPLWERKLQIPLNCGKIVTLAGVRRSGKTHHLYKVIQQLLQKGIAQSRIIYINFEDERLELSIKELDLILQAYRELYPDQDLKKCYFFFDEIQEVNGWEKFIARLYNNISQNIYITGSNAKLLSQEIASALRGRAITFEVFPLSFQEFVSILEPDLNYHSSQGKAKLVNLFKQFMTQGGFPELLNTPKNLKNKILQEYFNVMLVTDLIERYQISQTSILKYFCKRVIGNTANEFSVNKIYRELKSQGYTIGKNSLYAYQNYVESIYLARLIPKYSHSVVKTEMSQKKSYVIDQGLGSALDYKLSKDQGRLLKTVVCLELLKQDKNIAYLGNGFECDFIVSEKGRVTQAIQVSTDITDPDTRDREVKGLVKTCKAFKLKKGIIITNDQADEFKSDKTLVQITPAWQYFFQK